MTCKPWMLATNNPHDSHMPDMANQNVDRFTIAISKKKHTNNMYNVHHCISLRNPIGMQQAWFLPLEIPTSIYDHNCKPLRRPDCFRCCWYTPCALGTAEGIMAGGFTLGKQNIWEDVISSMCLVPMHCRKTQK